MEILDALKQTFMDPSMFWGRFTSFLPNLLAAIVLLAIGHILGRVFAMLVSKLLNRVGLDNLSAESGLGEAVSGAGFSATPSLIIGKIIYWLVFLTFIISAADTLGLDRVSETIDDFVLYLPRVIGAVLVAIVGLFAAGLVRAGVETALGSINVGYEKVVGGIVHGVIVLIVISLAIGQLEIETALLNQVVAIVLFAGAAAIALSLGLGTRDVAGNIVAGVYARELYVPGQKLRIGDVTGIVLEVTSTSLVLEAEDDKRITIPNRRLLEEQIEILG